MYACAPPTGATDNDWDCDDADGAVYPGVGCWFRMSYRGHAQATAYIVAGYAGTASYTCSNGGTATRTFSADSTASYGVSADSTCEVRSNVPFLTSIRPDNSWAEGTTLLRATDGSHLGTTLYGQGMGYVYVRNPSDADVAVTLASRSGSTWSTVSSGTVPAWGWLRLTTSFATSRLTADAPVLAYSSTEVQEQDQEYLVTDDGELVGTTFHYYSQESTRHDLLAQCVDPAGCFVAHFSNGAYATSAILDLGEYATFTSLTASVDHAVTSSGWMTVRAEGRATSTTSVPTDGTRVPGTSGEQRDVEHVFMTSAGGENNTFTDRFTDIYLYAYTEDTVVVIEELSGGAWSTVDTVILGVGEASHWGVELAPKRVFRTTASAPIDVELFGYGWEYSWTAFTDAPTAD